MICSHLHRMIPQSFCGCSIAALLCLAELNFFEYSIGPERCCMDQLETMCISMVQRLIPGPLELACLSKLQLQWVVQAAAAFGWLNHATSYTRDIVSFCAVH